MNLAFPVYKLPYEVQHKILYMVMKHPISYMIKDLKKEIDNLNDCRFNLYTKQIEPLSFYECLKVFRVLKKSRCRCSFCIDPLHTIYEKIITNQELDNYEIDLAFNFLF